MHSKLSPKCVKVARPTLFGYVETREEFEYYTNELFSLLQSGKLKVKIHKIYPLEDVAQCHKVGISRTPFLGTLANVLNRISKAVRPLVSLS